MLNSKDRVKFTATNTGRTVEDNAIIQAMHKAFDIKEETASNAIYTNTTIICSPSQFARFLIYRNELGGTNTFKELNATLFIPETKTLEINVSKNEA